MLFNIHVKLVDVKPEARSVSGKIVSGGQGCQDTFFRPNSLLLVGTVHLYVPAKQRHGRRPTHLRVEAEAQVDNGALTRRELNHSPVVKEQNLEGLKERPNANGADGRRGIKPFISADERRKSSLEALLSLSLPLCNVPECYIRIMETGGRRVSTVMNLRRGTDNIKVGKDDFP